MVNDHLLPRSRQAREQPGANRVGVVLDGAGDGDDRIVGSRVGGADDFGPSGPIGATTARATVAAYRTPGLSPASRAPVSSTPCAHAPPSGPPADESPPAASRLAIRTSHGSRQASNRSRVTGSRPVAYRGFAATARAVPSDTVSAAEPPPDTAASSQEVPFGSSRDHSA